MSTLAAALTVMALVTQDQATLRAAPHSPRAAAITAIRRYAHDPASPAATL